jgi:hypothetical protein
MAESNTNRFLKAFDASKQSHVEWLNTMMDLAENIHGRDFVKEVNSNPMGIQLAQVDALDWPHIHFVLGMAYAKAVLKGTAFIPCRTNV